MKNNDFTTPMFTKEDFELVAKLAEPGELIPACALFGARTSSPTKEDFEWASKLNSRKQK